MAQVCKSPLYSIIAPGGILLRHTKHQISDLFSYRWPTGALSGIGPFPRNELTMPSKKCIGRYNRSYFTE